MGRLVKNHIARLIVLTAATYQGWAALQGFLNPKVFFDIISKSMDVIVAPVPYLQMLNLILSLVTVGLEWPLPFISQSSLHCSFLVRLITFPINAMVALWMYQSTDPAFYYMIGWCLYLWAQREDEIILPDRWATPPSLE